MELNSDMAAVVTGGASGLGEATARLLVSKGVKVGIFDFNKQRGQEVANEIGAIFAHVNVADEKMVKAGFDLVRAANGQERVMVNAAGIGLGMKTASRKRDTGEILAHDIAAFRRVLDINLFGTFLCASQSAAGMMSIEPQDPDGERGVIINTASVAAQDGQIGQLAYAATKGGILSMALPMARDLAREGIRANTILPGFFETPIYEQMKPEVKDSLRAHLQFPTRFGDAREFAELAEFLITQTYMNAEYVRMDAGARMPPR